TPWRMIAIPLAAAGVLSVRRLCGREAALPLGLIAGGALLLNVECGAAATAGIGTYLFLRREPMAAWPHLVLRFSLGLLAALLAGGAVCFLALGYWPSPRIVTTTPSVVSFVMSSSYSGSPLVVEPLAFLMFAHSVCCLLYAAWTRGR